MSWSTTIQPHPRQSRRLRSDPAPSGVAKKMLLSTAVLGMVLSVVAGGTWAAFSDTTSNTNNDFSTGTVEISNDLGATAMFAVTGMSPLQSESGCIQVTYTGSLPATVRLFGATDAGGLDTYLDLVVERGASCSAFGTPTELYNGTLAAYPDGYAGGIVDTDASWSTGEMAAYRFTVTLQNDDAAQGLAVDQAFSWEARS